MSHLTTGEQAKLEHSLALAHRHIFQAQQLVVMRDGYAQADELRDMCQRLYTMLQDELKDLGRLRTRPPNRA